MAENGGTGGIVAELEGSVPLVEALLMPPRPTPTIVSRQRLLELMDKATLSAITIVSGEPAAGKTSLVIDWLQSTKPDRPTAWLTVQRGLDDPILFWRYVIAAVRSLGIDTHDLSLALADGEAPGDHWLTALANRLAAVAGDPVVVLDDLHELQSPEGFDSLLALLERAPPSLHVVLISRVRPPWPLTGWQMSGRIAEIDSQDLRYNAEEVRELLGSVGVELSEHDRLLLLGRTDGWAGGLRLALLSMRHSPDPGAFVTRFAADDELVSSYLLREVLERQPDDLRTFLLDISILDQVTAEACDLLRERDDSRDLLARCLAENLFLTEMSASHGTFQMHALMAQLLRATLGLEEPDRLRSLRCRASLIYEELGDVRSALFYAVQGADDTRIGELIAQHAGDFAHHGRFDEIRSWLTLLSTDTESVAPEVAIGLVMTLSICGRTDDARDQLDRLEARAISPRIRYASNQARLVSFAIDGSIEAMGSAADVLGQGAPDGDLALPFEPVRMAACYVGIASFFTGDLRRARASLEQAAGRRDDPNIQYVEAPGWLARVAHAEGSLAESERHAQECLARNVLLGGDETAVVTPAYVALADVAWEHNRLDEAELMLTKARRSVRPLLWYAVLEQVSASRVLASRGSLDAARQQLIECGQTYLSGESSPQLRLVLSEMALELALRADDADDARRWEHSWKACADRSLPTSLHLRLAALNGVETIPEMVDQAVATKQSLPHEIDTLLAAASVIGRLGDDRRCVDLVAHAARLAEPQRMIRRFVDAGEQVHAALQAPGVNPPTGAGESVASRFFVELLRSALNAETGGAAPPTPPNEELVEPLTVRELQVLQLLMVGRSYAEIGTELYVSRNTVKSHASHIYTKLGVSGRSQAAECARRLGLV